MNIEHLSRHYGELKAVDAVNFELKRGEVLGFLGPNGAGKSTTMQMITGNLAPTAGKITINDLDLLDQPKLAKAEIGYLPEQPPLYIELSVEEYLSFCAKINGINRATQNSAIEKAIERCGLGEVKSRLISNLSKGYQQRVGIAQAIIHSPSIVILDEPTVGLDPIQIREIRKLIRELGEEHSVILSTHILPEVQMTCDRVQIINKGQLVFSDSIDNLNQSMQATSLIVQFDNKPDDATLDAVDNVNKIEHLEDRRIRIHFNNTEAQKSPAKQIAIEAANNNWGLLELTPEQKTLEQIFVEITSSEHNTNEQQEPDETTGDAT